jgi:hypothetical protein
MEAQETKAKIRANPVADFIISVIVVSSIQFKIHFMLIVPVVHGNKSPDSSAAKAKARMDVFVMFINVRIGRKNICSYGVCTP